MMNLEAIEARNAVMLAYIGCGLTDEDTLRVSDDRKPARMSSISPADFVAAIWDSECSTHEVAEGVAVAFSETGRAHTVTVHNYGWTMQEEYDPFYGALTPAIVAWLGSANETLLCG